MQKTSYLNTLLERKLPDASEIELHLFELCNLRCHFCGQDHDDKTGFDVILNKIDPVKEFISSNQRKNHILNIMGGEVFNDELPDSILDDYLKLTLEVHRHAESIGHHCTFNWVTNLIFNKTERIKEFLDQLTTAGVTWNISTSYDFAGRKTSLWSMETFRRNLDSFKGRVFTVGFVLTKPAIRHLIAQKDEFFDYLYQNYPLYFDYYVPENGANLNMPSDAEILEGFLYIAKNYPEISPVKDLIKNEQNKMTCYSLNKLTLLPDGKEVKCRYLDYKDGQFKNTVDYSSNENIIQSHLDENQCLSCEWFDRCSFRCFVQADWATRQKMDTCLFKIFFEKVSSWN